MNAHLFEVLGKYGGLGGLVIGLVLLVFRDIIQRATTKKGFAPSQAFRLLQSAMYLVFVIGVLGISAWAVVSIVSHRTSTGEVRGRVMDKNTRRGVENTEIVATGKAETVKSDHEGTFVYPVDGISPEANRIHLYFTKDGYEVSDQTVTVGDSIDVFLLPALTKAQLVPDPDKNPPPAQPQMVTVAETYWSDEAASGACDAVGAWATVCTPEKPAEWTITYQHFELTGDRAGCRWAECLPAGEVTATRACYKFRTQGHSEECHAFSGNTGIHYSKGRLDVVWTHPATTTASHAALSVPAISDLAKADSAKP